MNVDFSYVRKNKGKKLRELFNKEFEKKELGIESYINATILPLRKFPEDRLAFGRGGVVDKDGNYIPKSGIDEEIIFYGYDFESPVISDKKVVFLGYLNNQWGHFLVDAITRMWYYLLEDNTVDKYVFYTKQGKTTSLSGNYKKFLELYGIIDKIEIINEPTQYREVIVPEIAYKRGEWFSEEYKNIFRRVSDNVILNGKYDKKIDKIFLSRSQFKPERELGLEMLDNLFSKNGFTIIYPEKVEFEYLIYLLNQANEVATMDGSCQHNILFGKDTINLYIIDRRVFWEQHLIDICRIKQVNATIVDANIPIYTIDIYGPFIMYCNDQLNSFCANHMLLLPNSKFLNKHYLRKLLKGYFRCYKRMYERQWCMRSWYERDMYLLTEAYNDSYRYIGEYLSVEKPLFIYDFFNTRYWKRIIKRIITKDKNR